MEKPMSQYAADAPRVLRDFSHLYFDDTGKSSKTAHEYYLDLRLFFRVLKHNKGLVPKDLPLDRESRSRTLILISCGMLRFPMPMIIWNICQGSGRRSKTVPRRILV